jgi:hypothetical protein
VVSFTGGGFNFSARDAVAHRKAWSTGGGVIGEPAGEVGSNICRRDGINGLRSLQSRRDMRGGTGGARGKRRWAVLRLVRGPRVTEKQSGRREEVDQWAPRSSRSSARVAVGLGPRG